MIQRSGSLLVRSGFVLFVLDFSVYPMAHVNMLCFFSVKLGIPANVWRSRLKAIFDRLASVRGENNKSWTSSIKVSDFEKLLNLEYGEFSFNF